MHTHKYILKNAYTQTNEHTHTHTNKYIHTCTHGCVGWTKWQTTKKRKQTRRQMIKNKQEKSNTSEIPIRQQTITNDWTHLHRTAWPVCLKVTSQPTSPNFLKWNIFRFSTNQIRVFFVIFGSWLTPSWPHTHPTSWTLKFSLQTGTWGMNTKPKPDIIIFDELSYYPGVFSSIL